MNDQTLLHRQVHPSWVQANRITSQVFRPTPKDRKKLSVYDGDRISAADCWMFFTATLGYASAGVVAVTVGECEELRLSTASDPASHPAHALVDFTRLTDREIERTAKKLRDFAMKRDWQYRVDSAG